MDPYASQVVFHTNQNLIMEDDKIPRLSKDETIKAFKHFIKEHQVGSTYVYREQIQSNLLKNLYYVEFNYEDINSSNEYLANLLVFKPAESIPLFEKAIKEIVLELSVSYKSIDNVPDLQFLLVNNSHPKTLRDLNTSSLHQLVIISGIIVSSSKPQIKATKMVVQCRNCGNLKTLVISSGFGGVSIPRMCENGRETGEQKEQCPMDSYTPVPELCEYIDIQTLKIQEAPEMIPTGEVPRSFILYCERYLVNKVSPGTRLSVVGVLTVSDRKEMDQVRSSYIKVQGFQVEGQKTGKLSYNFSQEDEARFLAMAKDPKIYDKISKSIASAIYGSEDVKKAIACLLFGGCRKKLSEGVNLRGDVNILLLGDPSTAKSQFLKFTERVAPIAVYTSGKGSSAAGLTASIIKDSSSGEFQLEGGAMVLADGGIVCIDEFDKMRTQDRVAIHEAMEQQTISVAKAGITTTLNSRCSVLAAANPIYGRLDELKSTQDQIDFQTTILSRFDCIFLVRDIRDTKKDEDIAGHIIDLNISGKGPEKEKEGEISIVDLKKYIAYARMKCTPRLTNETGQLLQNYYVADRKNVKENRSGKKKNAIPVTVRQLEAIIRLSEAIAKMSLSQTVKDVHVHEAHRLFNISTLSAASSGNNRLDIPSELVPMIIKVEESIKRRLALGAKVSYTKLIEELSPKFSNSRAIEYAVLNMVKREELGYMESRQIIIRKK